MKKFATSHYKPNYKPQSLSQANNPLFLPHPFLTLFAPLFEWGIGASKRRTPRRADIHLRMTSAGERNDGVFYQSG